LVLLGVLGGLGVLSKPLSFLAPKPPASAATVTPTPPAMGKPAAPGPRPSGLRPMVAPRPVGSAK
jgi:hypothetical protein